MNRLILLCFVSACQVADPLEEMELEPEPVEHRLYLPLDTITFHFLSGDEFYHFEKYKGWTFIYRDSADLNLVTNTRQTLDSISLLLPYNLIEYLQDRAFILPNLGFTIPAEVEKRKPEMHRPFVGILSVYTSLRTSTMIHELGHVYDISTNYPLEVKSEINRLFNNSPLNGYSKRNVREFYAEIFRLFHTEANTLQAQYPDSYYFLLQNLKIR